jgi:hypothetical protein
MKFDLRRPCDNCPFRTDINFPLERERVEEIVDSITRQDQTFACHKTTKHCPETGEHIPSKKEQHCAGALILLEKTENPNQMMRIAERLGYYDRTRLDMAYVPVYDDGPDMIASGPWLNSERRSTRAPARPSTKPAPAKARGPWKAPARSIRALSK